MLGDALFPDWFPQWFLDYTASHDAIVIAANYRLLPGVKGLEILSDVRDLFSWMRTSLNTHLDGISPGVQADIDQVLVAGESAGGYLAIQSALLEGAFVKAVVAGYPMLDYESEFFSTNIPKVIFDAPMMSIEDADAIISAAKSAPVMSENLDPAAMVIAKAVLQQGRIGELLGDDESLFPMKTVGKVKALPFTFIMHGKQDTVVPVEGTENFAKTAGERLRESLHVEYRDGEHGFDADSGLDDEWLQRGLAKVTKAWLG